MKPKVLFVYTHLSTFVKGDIEILEKDFDVREYLFKNQPNWRLPFSLIKQFLFLLFSIRKFEVVYIWFADYHSFLPSVMGKIFKRRVFIVIGGYDVCREKKYRYGSFAKPLRAWMTLISIKKAYKNLAVSKNLARVLSAIAPTAKIEVVYNGVREALIHGFDTANGTLPRGKGVICVALVGREQGYYIKGIDRFVELAKRLPEIRFTLVGTDPELVERINIEIPANLNVVRGVPHEALQKFYLENSVYCQPSRRESFSLSLAEAMSFNLTPVVTRVGGMPEIVGNLGYIANGNQLEDIADKIKAALEENFSINYRERIISEFSIHRRAENLLKTIHS